MTQTLKTLILLAGAAGMLNATAATVPAPLPEPVSNSAVAAVAISAGELMYVFGGYTVAEDGSDVSTPWVHAFDPVTSTFRERSPMPVPVDDAVVITYGDRYIYLISGWHDLGNVNLVQAYDTQSDSWSQATPIPGNALFGHAGGAVGHTMLYCDGVAVKPSPTGPRKFVASNECFLGTIDADNFRRIDWHPVAAHPGLPRYRMAASGIVTTNTVMFVGGSENPYNFNGIGYDGEPSEPASSVLLFDVANRTWEVVETHQPATMDHRGLVYFDGRWLTLGGMGARQKVIDDVVRYKAR